MQQRQSPRAPSPTEKAYQESATTRLCAHTAIHLSLAVFHALSVDLTFVQTLFLEPVTVPAAQPYREKESVPQKHKTASTRDAPRTRREEQTERATICIRRPSTARIREEISFVEGCLLNRKTRMTLSLCRVTLWPGGCSCCPRIFYLLSS